MRVICKLKIFEKQRWGSDCSLGTLRIFYYKAARQKVKQKTKGTSFMTG